MRSTSYSAKPKPPSNWDAGVGRLPARLGRQVLGHVGLGAAGLPRVEQLAGAKAHQVGGRDLDPGLGDGERHALVLADRPAEDDALARIARHPVDEPVAVADALGGDQRALGVEPVEDVLEALAFLADQVVDRDLEVLENSSLVSWLTMLAIGRTVMPLFSAWRRSTMKIDMPSVFFFTSASAVVRACSTATG